MEIILGIIIVILLVIVAALAVIAAALYDKDRQDKAALETVITKTVEDAFKHEKKKIAKMYAEERRIIKWADKVLKSDSVDIAKLATETEQRAYVLALKKAEDAVLSAEQGLEKIRQEILRAQGDAIQGARSQFEGSYKHNKKALQRLYAQEEIAEQRVESARKRLTLLTADVSTTDLNEALESLDVAPAMVPAAATQTEGSLILPIEMETIVDTSVTELDLDHSDEKSVNVCHEL